MAYAIYDNKSNEFFQLRPTSTGWYNVEHINMRRYKTALSAQRVIDQAGHHVSYPGNRNLTVIAIS